MSVEFCIEIGVKTKTNPFAFLFTYLRYFSESNSLSLSSNFESAMVDLTVCLKPQIQALSSENGFILEPKVHCQSA